MGALQRNKGIAAERAVATLIRDWLGLDVRRNWQAQSAEGGPDLTGIPGWSLEIKHAKAFRSEWWDQAMEQAADYLATPALVYLLDNTRRGQPLIDRWRVILPLHVISRYDVEDWLTAEISLRAWIQIAREALPTRTPTPERPVSAPPQP